MSETQRTIANLSLPSGVDEIDPDAITRFIEGTVNRQPVDPADTMQAAVLLWAIRRGMRAGDEMGKELRRVLKTRKAQKKKYLPLIANPPSD